MAMWAIMMILLMAILPRGASARKGFRSIPDATTTGIAQGMTQPSGDVPISSNSKLMMLDEITPPPSIDYIGLGYDLVYANPNGDPKTQIDPGFRLPVVELSWDESVQNRDGTMLDLSNGVVIPQTSCFMAQTGSETSSSSEYTESLAADAQVAASLSIGGGSGSFSGSAGMNEFENDIASTNSRRFMYKSFCLSYKAQFIDPDVSGEPYTSTKHFHAAATKLLSDPNMTTDFELWNRFFSVYGTHFTSEVDFGGKMLYQQTITERSQEKIKESGQSVAAAAEVAYDGLIASASASASASKQTSKGSTAGSTSSEFEVKIFVFGGIPPTSGANTEAGFSEWSETVHGRPMPVRYQLTPLWKMSEFQTVENGTTVAKTMTSLYFDENGVDPAVVKTTNVKAKKLRKLEAGTKLTFENGNCLESDSTYVKLDVSTKGELRLTYKSSLLWSNHPHYSSEEMGPFSLHLSSGGKLSTVDKHGTVLWSTTLNGFNCVVDNLKISDDGDLQMMLANGKAIWGTGTKNFAQQNKPAGVKGFSPLYVFQDMLFNAWPDEDHKHIQNVHAWGIGNTDNTLVSCDAVGAKLTTSQHGVKFKIDLQKAIELKNAYPCKDCPFLYAAVFCPTFFDE